MSDHIQQAKKLVEFQYDMHNATKLFLYEMDALNKQYGGITFNLSYYNPISVTMILQQNLEQLQNALSGYQVLYNLVAQLHKDQGRSRMTAAFKKDKSQHQMMQNRVYETLQDLQANIYQTIDHFVQNFKSGVMLATEQMGELVIARSTELIRSQLTCNTMGATQTLNNLFFTGNLTADSVRKQVFKFSSHPLQNTGVEYMEDTKIDLCKID